MPQLPVMPKVFSDHDRALREELGPVPVRAAQDAPGGHHRQHKDPDLTQGPPVRADLPHLPGDADPDHDHQGVSPQILRRVHHHCPQIR